MWWSANVIRQAASNGDLEVRCRVLCCVLCAMLGYLVYVFNPLSFSLLLSPSLFSFYTHNPLYLDGAVAEGAGPALFAGLFLLLLCCRERTSRSVALDESPRSPLSLVRRAHVYICRGEWAHGGIYTLTIYYTLYTIHYTLHTLTTYSFYILYTTYTLLYRCCAGYCSRQTATTTRSSSRPWQSTENLS
jgi:hypothetical protein